MRNLFHAGRFLVEDFLSTLFFVGLFAITHNVYLATGAGIALAGCQILWAFRAGRRPDVMQWLSLGLVTVFGGASLVLHDPRFIMFKPTLIYAAIGVVMLKPGWMTRYLPPVAQELAGDVADAFGYVWAGLMLLTGALNAVLALTLPTAQWTAFIAVFPLASKLALFAVQYGVMRAIAVRRKRLALAAA